MSPCLKQVLVLSLHLLLISCAPQKAGDLVYNEDPLSARGATRDLPTNISFKDLESKVLNPLGCLNCHGAMKSESGFKKYIKASEPFDSKAYLRMEDGSMPPFGTKASKEQLELVEAYIRLK